MYIYWIHLPSHTNMFTDGYIGISKHPFKRFKDHKRLKQNIHLQRAFEKYRDIEITLILESKEDYCKFIEENLRPDRQIGWNIEKGGGKPPINNRVGFKHSITSKELMSIKRKGVPKGKQSDTHKTNKAFSRARDYEITFPNGKIEIIHNLSEFCRSNNLTPEYMRLVADGKQKYHKKFLCKRLFEKWG